MSDAGFLGFLTDSLAPLGSIRMKRMFGGAGFYCDGIFFALIAYDRLYFKADEATSQRYANEGEGPFVYDGKTKPVTMSYWRVPERLFDDPDELLEWARQAVGVARRAQLKSPAKAVKKSSRATKPAAKKARGKLRAKRKT